MRRGTKYGIHWESNPNHRQKGMTEERRLYELERYEWSHAVRGSATSLR